MIPPCKLFFQAFGHRQIKQLIKKARIQEWGHGLTKHHYVLLKTLKLVLRKNLEKLVCFEPNTLKSTICRAEWVILVGAYKTKMLCRMWMGKDYWSLWGFWRWQGFWRGINEGPNYILTKQQQRKQKPCLLSVHFPRLCRRLSLKVID